MNDNKKILIVIPARYDSSRFPGKPLVEINGVPMIQRTYNQALKNKYTKDIVIATDSSRIATYCNNNDMNVVMTSRDCLSGTDRVAEVVTIMPQFDCYANLQGDEPVINPIYIDNCIESFYQNYPKYDVITGYGLLDKEHINLKEKVKVVFNNNKEAIYFSRSPIPNNAEKYHNHIGLYCFSKDSLSVFQNRNVGVNELCEKVEMIGMIELDIKVKMIKMEETFTVDIPSDVKKIEEFLNKKII
jgi:3-deoxy-manno-octulosonate cytidylyltransferase (CMP-KDO synthetase)